MPEPAIHTGHRLAGWSTADPSHAGSREGGTRIGHVTVSPFDGERGRELARVARLCCCVCLSVCVPYPAAVLVPRMGGGLPYGRPGPGEVGLRGLYGNREHATSTACAPYTWLFHLTQMCVCTLR
jgi:hypothetical protein